MLSGLGASVQEHQVTSLFLDKTLCSPLISNLQHNTMYIIVKKSEKKNKHECIYSCRYVYYPRDKVLEKFENEFCEQV